MLTDFEQVIFPILLYLRCFLTSYWFVQFQQHFYIVAVLQHNSGSMAADFEKVTVSIRLVFTWLLCIYIILEKDCHILNVFGLNSKVYSHIVGVHLSIDQVTYDFMIDVDLYNSFSLRLRIKSF